MTKKISIIKKLLVICHDYFLMQPQGTPENGFMWNRISPELGSPNQPYSLREALAQAQSSRIGSTARALRESLHPILRQELVSITFCVNLVVF